MAIKKISKKSNKKSVSEKSAKKGIAKKRVEDKKKENLKKEVENNTTVIKKDNHDKTEEIIKQGTPLDHATKKADSYIGMSKGVTVNMDNYESLRVDCWLSIPLEDKMPTEKFMELSEIIQEQLEYEVTQIVNQK